MHVLMALYSLRRGGAERIAIELALHLKDKGHTVSFITLTDVNEYAELTERVLNITSLVSARRLRWPMDVPQYILKFQHARREISPDVIQVHDPSMAWIAAFGAGHVPCCHLIHGYPMILRHGGALKRAFAKLIDKATFRRMSRRVMAVSPSLQHAASSHLNCSVSDIECIVNGIDIERFAYVVRRPLTKPQILFVGTLAPYKRPDRLIAAFEELLKYLPDGELSIVGDGPLRDQLVANVEVKRLASKIKFLGQRRDVGILMRNAHLLWLLSDVEGLPLVVAEAMASGLPVIGSRVPGITDIIKDGITGYLVELGDPATVAMRSFELLSDGVKYNEFSLAGRELVVRKFDVRQMVSGHENYFSNTISSHQSK